MISKPAELLTVPGRYEGHEDCLESRAQALFPGALITHRLDMVTSGVIVLAMNKAAHRSISMQFERRKTKKVYEARVWGRVEEQSGHIDLPLICDWPNRPRQMVCHENGKPSQTDWEVMGYERLASGAEVTRMKLMPITGRSHQLRVHMMALGHPILGDHFYAHEEAYRAAERLHLHALSLTIHHPDGGALMTFTDPCPF